MQRFSYKAIDATGRRVEGEVEAGNHKNAIGLIRKKKLIVLSIKPLRSWTFGILGKITSQTSSNEFSSFTRQLATMVGAGLPITEALIILRSQISGHLQAVVSQILADVEEGESLSKSMGKHEIFNKTYISLIKAGEVGGVLDDVLLRLADTLEKQQEFKGKVKTALVYPTIIVVGMVIVGFIMMVFVIPRLTTLYDQFDADLPTLTTMIVSISDFMVNYWFIVILGLVVSIYSMSAYKKTKKGKERIDKITLKTPIIGDLQHKVILTEITRTLALMIGSGVSILDALNISSDVVSNSVVSLALKDAAVKVEKGFPLAFAFSKHPEAFPFILSQMIAVGEETGKMDEVLSKLSHIFEVESEQKLKTLTSAVEPIILLVLGVGVAVLVIAIIMPIYNLTTQL